MGRADFGGAADYSQYFLQLYESYAQRIEANAQAAIREAEEERAAEDRDMMNRWEAGEISDAEWIAHVKRRLATTTDDAEMQAYWKDVLRDSQEKIKVERIEDGARTIMAGIDAGTHSWTDLRNFYARERQGVNPKTDLYDQITDQLNEVNGRIADNAAEGAIAEAEYLFRSGQISGAEAANRIRAAAGRYAKSDPARYYSLLSSAYDLQTYGSGSGGSGGGGGGGGGGTGGPSLNSVIDSLEYTADAISLLNDQFGNGKRIGTLPDGTEVPLADEAGNPLPDIWRQIDEQFIEAKQAAYEAKLQNGDRDAVEMLRDIEQYIADNVQPRNTIPKERQFGLLTNTVARAVELANQDPERGAAAIRAALEAMDRWASRLNTTTEITDRGERADDARMRENPELAAASRREATVAADPLAQVEGSFAADAQAWVAAARQAFENPNLTPEQAQTVVDSAGGLMTATEAGRLLGGLQQVATVDAGLRDGSWVRVQLPNGELTAVPLVDQAVTGPNGEAVTARRPDLSGLDIDPERQDAAMVVREVNGQPQAVWAVGDYREINGQRLLVLTDGASATYRTDTGQWINAANGEQMPLPFFGRSRGSAQRWVNENPQVAAELLQNNGVDPTTVDMAHLFLPSAGATFTTEDRRHGMEARGVLRRQRYGSVDTSPDAMYALPERQHPMDALRPENYQRGFVKPDVSSLGKVMGDTVQGVGRNLGIRFEVEEAGRAAFRAPRIQPVARVNVRAPEIRPITLRPLNLLRVGIDNNVRAGTDTANRYAPVVN